jgi:uroporphyrinogen-III synthase
MSLTGKRILITRTRHQASDLARGLEALGAEPILIPTIEITPPTSYASLDAAMEQLQNFDWLLFTSANAVEAFHHHRPNLQWPQNHPKIAAIGPATARTVQGIGRKVDLIPPQAIAESLAESLLPHAAGARMLLVRAEQARDHLPEALRAAGATLTLADAYRTVIPESSITALRDLFASRFTHPDAITFTSSSTASNLFALLESAAIFLPGEIALASIGPITSETLRNLGHPPSLEAAEPTVAGLITALETFFVS